MSNALWMTAGIGELIGEANAISNSPTLSMADHELTEFQQVTVSGGSGGATSLVEGAPYWVRNIDGDSFSLAPSPGAPVMEYDNSGTVNVHEMSAVYTAKNLRRFNSSLMSPGNGGLTTTTGIRPGNEIASISAATITVRPFSGVAQPLGDDWPSDNGPYMFIVPAELTLQVPPADTQSRVDSLVLRIQDNDAELTGVNDATVYIKEGTAGHGFPPSLLDAEVQLGTINVPPSGPPSMHLQYRNNTALGGIEPVRTIDGLPNTGLYEGRYADVANRDELHRYDGSDWVPVSSGAWARGLIADSGALLSSAEFGSTEVVLRQATDAAAYTLTFDAEAGRNYRIDVSIEMVDKSNSGSDDDNTHGSKGSAMFAIRGTAGTLLNTSSPILSHVAVPVFDNAATRAGGMHFTAILRASTTGTHVCGVTAYTQETTSNIRALRLASSPMNRITVSDVGAML